MNILNASQYYLPYSRYKQHMKTPVPLTSSKEALVEAQKVVISQAQQEVTRLTALSETFRVRLESERAQGPPQLEQIQSKLAQLDTQAQYISQQIQKAKALSKKRKKEIDEWKLWYNGLGETDKSAELAQLNQEIDWRAAEIAKAEAKIADLSAQLLAQEGEEVALKQQLQALEAGVYDKPLEEDPRLVSVMAQLTNAQELLNQAQQGIKDV